MSTNYHTPIPVESDAEAFLFNSRYSSLDAQLTTASDQAATTASEVVGARGGYDSLDARLANLVIAGGNVATLTNGTAAAGQNVVTVDSTSGFVAGAYVAYSLNGGNVEYNQIDAITDGTHLLLIDNIGTGGILNDTYISMISTSEYQAANAINHGSQELTLREAMIYAAGDVHNVLAYGAAGDGVVNDLTAIQAAIDAAKAAGGGVILFPAGTYRINGALDLCNTANIRLQGAGCAYPAETTGTIIECRNTNKAAIEIIGSHAIELADLQVKGHGSNTPAVGIWTGRSTAVGGTNTSLILFTRIVVYGAFTKAAVYNTGCESNIFKQFYTYVTNSACLAGLMWDWENSLALTPEHATLNTSYPQAMCSVHESFLTCDGAATSFSPIYIVNETGPITLENTYVVAYGAPIYYMLGTGMLVVKNDYVEGTPTYIIHGDYNAGDVNVFRMHLSGCSGPAASASYAIYFDDSTEVRDSLIERCNYVDDLRFYDVSATRIEHWCDYNASVNPTLTIAHQSSNCYFNVEYADTYSNASPKNTTVVYNSDPLAGYVLLPGLAVDANASPGSTGQAQLSRILTGSASWSPGAIGNGSSASTAVSLSGPIAAGAWFCLAHFSGLTTGSWEISAYAQDSAVCVTITNRTGGSVTPTGTVHVLAIKVA